MVFPFIKKWKLITPVWKIFPPLVKKKWTYYPDGEWNCWLRWYLKVLFRFQKPLTKLGKSMSKKPSLGHYAAQVKLIAIYWPYKYFAPGKKRSIYQHKWFSTIRIRLVQEGGDALKNKKIWQ